MKLLAMLPLGIIGYMVGFISTGLYGGFVAGGNAIKEIAEDEYEKLTKRKTDAPGKESPN